MYIQVDAKQLEWRGVAWLSNDQVALHEINKGVDTHTENEKAFGLPDRLIAKRYLFRTIYRGSGWAFAHDNDFSSVSSDPDFWDDINEKFYRKYHGIDAWHKDLARIVAARKPIISPLGREWLILPKPNGDLPWTVFTNYPVQGTSADLMSVARVSMLRRIKAALRDTLMVSTVHDSIVLDTTAAELDQAIAICLAVFNDLPKNVQKLWNVTLPCPFPGEVSYGPNLKDLTKVE